MLDEKSQMLRVSEGEIGALSELFEANHKALFNFFLKMGLNSALGEDLVQETFMRILAYRKTFNGSSSFKAWLYRIARNTVSDHFRKLSNQNNHDSFDENVIETDSTLLDSIEKDSKQFAFDKALAGLPIEQREIIVLSRFQQLCYDEIADMLNCNINTLKTRMRTAIYNLRAQYLLVTGENTL